MKPTFAFAALLAAPLLLVSTLARADERTMTCGGKTLSFMKVPAGTFAQGSPPGEAGRRGDETVREVTATFATWIGTTPVTVGEFAAFVKATSYVTHAERAHDGRGWDGKELALGPAFTWKNPGFAQTDAHPVVLVTHEDARAFARWLACDGATVPRLPTEAELEHAMRGNETTFGTDWAKTRGYFAGTTIGTRPVRQKAPNGFGLFDLVGHVRQWTDDLYLARTADEAIDPTVLDAGADADADAGNGMRVVKGGSWRESPDRGRPAARSPEAADRASADLGFRLAFVDLPKPIPDAGLDLFEPIRLKNPEPLKLADPEPAPASDSLVADAIVVVVLVAGAVVLYRALKKKEPR